VGLLIGWLLVQSKLLSFLVQSSVARCPEEFLALDMHLQLLLQTCDLVADSNASQILIICVSCFEVYVCRGLGK